MSSFSGSFTIPIAPTSEKETPMKFLNNKLRIEIFKYVDTPISLLLTDRKWLAISQDPHARTEWLIYKYGKAHALIQAIRLADSFVTPDVIDSLLAKNVIISRYFIQRLVKQFGLLDQKLIDCKLKYSLNRAGSDRVHEYDTPWASTISIPIFTQLLTEGYKIFNDDGFAIRGSDMELFHYLTADAQKLRQNLNSVEDLILNKKFLPFPSRPKKEGTIISNEKYPPKDSYENHRQLNILARAILINPELINMWKKIGYYEICSDLNELVIQGTLAILFPLTIPQDWRHPDVDMVVNHLKQLIDMGFQLNEKVATESIHLFVNRLEVCNILLESFKVLDPKIVISND